MKFPQHKNIIKNAFKLTNKNVKQFHQFEQFKFVRFCNNNFFMPNLIIILRGKGSFI